MKKYWIYIGKNSEGTVDTKYFVSEPNDPPKDSIFVGTCDVEPEFFGGNLPNRFNEDFEKYAEKYYQSKIKKIFKIK